MKKKIYKLLISLLCSLSITSCFVANSATHQMFNHSNQHSSCLKGEIYDPIEKICFYPITCHDHSCKEIGDQYLDKLTKEFGYFLESEQEGPSENKPHRKIASYYVIDGELDQLYIEDTRLRKEEAKKYEELWHTFADVIPLQHRQMINRFHIYTDGKNGELARVEQDAQNVQKWSLHIDIADTHNTKDLIVTFIHEFGHLLTLNIEQLPIDQRLLKTIQNDASQEEVRHLMAMLKEQCGDHYFDKHFGCSSPTSYIDAFYRQFWINSMAEWEAAKVNTNDFRLLQYYYQHEDKFVSEYAASSVVEDLAESWSFFILTKQPEPIEIKDEKMIFFYQYPELVQLRANILARLYSKMKRLEE